MSDSLDQLLTDEFARFDADERGSDLPMPGPLAVRRTVTHRRRIRYTSFGVLGAMLIAVPVLLIAGPKGNHSPPYVVDTGQPTVTSPAPLPTPSPRPTTPAEVLNATLTLPAFPGLGSECGDAGTRTFVNGSAYLANSVAWTIGRMYPITADLDGAAGDELLTTIRCDTEAVHVTQLLALKAGGDGRLRALGYVINSRDVPVLSFTPEEVQVSDGVVLVKTRGPYQSDGWPACTPQVRGYAYRAGAFKQVSGPTSFPSAPTNLRSVDLRNTGVLISMPDTAGGGIVYCVPMAGGAGTADVWIDNDPARGSRLYTFTIGPISFIADHFVGEAAAAVVTYSYSGETVATAVQIFTLDSGSIVGNALQVSGVDGVTRIDTVEVNGDQLVVTLTVGGASQIWTYRQSTESGTWQRSN